MKHVVLTLALLAAGGAHAQTDSTTAPSVARIRGLVGDYHFNHKISMFMGGVEEMYPATDALSIREAAGVNRYVVQMETVSTNGHSCTFEGVAQLEGNRLVYRQPVKDFRDREGLCELTVTQEKGRLVVLDKDRKCSSDGGFCGARATLYGTYSRNAAPRRSLALILDPKNQPSLMETMNKTLQLAIQSRQVLPGQWQIYSDGRTCIHFKRSQAAQQVRASVEESAPGSVTEAASCPVE